MKQSRKNRSSDSSDEDRHGHKHSKRTSHHRVKLPAGEMGSKHRSSANECGSHKHNKQSRHSCDKHATDDMARHSSRRSHGRSSPPRVHDPESDSDSSDEILLKGRASRHSHRDEDRDGGRRLKSIDKTQKGSFRLSSSSSSSKEKDSRFGPVTSKSDSPPPRQSQSRSSGPSKSAGISVNAITNQMKGITKSLLGRRSEDSYQTSRPSRRHPKQERRDKHGKKRDSTSKFLAPLAQRWVCYQCGKLRSYTIEQRHPLKKGERMQPNWCGKCRVHRELSGRPLAFQGKRHYCWGCGIVRSNLYQAENPIRSGEESIPNFCKPCREVAPAFDYKLRETSDIGSAASVRDVAFSHQLHEAELSDLVEEEEEDSHSAPGKENLKPASEKKLKVSMSFMLENCSNKVRTISDETTVGSQTTSDPEAQHVDQERARSTSSGGCRLSDESYQPPTVESLVSETCKPEVKSTGVTEESLSAMDGFGNCEMKNSNQSTGNTEPSNPTAPLAHKQQRNSDDSIKKKVHWAKEDAASITADSNVSDSDNCRAHPSDFSYKPADSRRSRCEPCGGSSDSRRPTQEGESTEGHLRSILSKWNASRQAESRRKGFGEDVSVHETFGIFTQEVDADTGSSRRDSSQSSNSIPATPDEYLAPAFTGQTVCTGKREYKSSSTPWVDSTEIPSFSRPDLSPTEQSPDVSDNFSSSFLSPPQPRAEPSYDAGPAFDTGFGDRFGNMQDYGQFNPAAYFSDSTHGRDYSEFNAPSEAYTSFPSEFYGSNMQQNDYQNGYPPGGYPTYNDYHTSAGGYEGGYFGSYGDSASFPSSSGPSSTPFDFSGFGQATGGDGIAPEPEKFVRSKKKKTTTKDTPRPQSWQLYDDGDESGSVPNTTSCEWRKDGRTTVHRSDGGDNGGKLPNEGMTLRILSIREIDSDEETTINEDDDDFSELDTVVGEDSAMKSICAD